MEELSPAQRWAELRLIQEHYSKFEIFLQDVMTDVLGFRLTDIQEDIGKYMAYGPKYKMVQAQRGQAKTTIAAIYAVWRLIHDPSLAVMVLSAGSSLATEISNWIIQIILYMPELTCIRPDETSRDRTSVLAFDLHHVVKGPGKSASVSCIGLASHIQGRRAGLIIADDIESKKNSKTAKLREELHDLTKDFMSICTDGDIIYLGTPQNTDSVYNGLPSRGFHIRIWTGRYPTPIELPNYQGYLAPLLLGRIKADPSLQTGGGPTGERGKPTDPVMMSEDILTAKEIDQGRAYFQLQHMLDTKLMDADRYPLKLKQILFMPIPATRCPVEINWTPVEENRILLPQGYPIQEYLYRVTSTGAEFSDFTGTHMYVDPSGGGQNGDELAYAITKFLAGKVFVVDVGGCPGGLGTPQLDRLTAAVIKWKPNCISIEENYGKGAFCKVWSPVLLKAMRDNNFKSAIEEVWETGQKELRIIDTLEPIIGSNRLVVEQDLIQRDWESVNRYPTEKRSSFALFFQLARITRDKGALLHDDRLDALAGSCRHWVEHLALDSAKIAAKIRQDNYNKMISNPLGNGRPVLGMQVRQPNCLDKFRMRDYNDDRGH